MFDPWLAGSGFVVGVLIGLTGVGGTGSSSIPGVWVGSRLSQVVPRAPLRLGLAVLLGTSGLQLSLW